MEMRAGEFNSSAFFFFSSFFLLFFSLSFSPSFPNLEPFSFFPFTSFLPLPLHNANHWPNPHLLTDLITPSFSFPFSFSLFLSGWKKKWIRKQNETGEAKGKN